MNHEQRTRWEAIEDTTERDEVFWEFENIKEIIAFASKSSFYITSNNIQVPPSKKRLGSFSFSNHNFYYNGVCIIKSLADGEYYMKPLFRAGNPDLADLVTLLFKELGAEIINENLYDINPALAPQEFVEEDWLKISRMIKKQVSGSYQVGKYRYANKTIYFNRGREWSEVELTVRKALGLRTTTEIVKHIEILRWLKDNCETWHNSSFAHKYLFDFSPIINHDRLQNLIEEWSVTNATSAFSTYSFATADRNWAYNRETKMMNYTINGVAKVMKGGKGLMKLGKQIGVQIPNEQIKEWLFRLDQSDEFTLKIVEGADIRKYYRGANYDRSANLGSLSSSCMRYEDRNIAMKVYEDHPKVKMLILHNSYTDKIRGRAILWETDRGTNFMDRVYSSESTYHKFFDWAKENNYMRKRYQSYTSRYSFILPDGTEKSYTKLKVSFPSLEGYEKAPYMDTFAYYDKEGKYFTNGDDRSIDYYCLQNQYGNFR